MTVMNEEKDIVALFDFDGVVMDTETQYTVFWDEVGKEYFPEIASYGRHIKGQTLMQIYDKYLPGKVELQAQLTERLNRFEEQMHFNFIPGVVDFMKELRLKGVKMAIVTSSNNLKMEKAFRAHPELHVLVDRILTADMFAHSKPHPECFLMGAEVFGVSAEDCVVFEDSFHGLEAGSRAGMKVIGLATTNHAEAIADKCEMVITDFVGFTYEKMKAVLD